MDTKFSSKWWAHPQVEAAPAELKLAGAWMRTNDQVTLFGYAAVTPKRFAYETGLPPEDMARAIEALPDWFTRATGGYFMPGYIGEQIGRGEALVRNLVCKPMLRALVGLGDPSVSALVTEAYPELIDALKVLSLPKPLASPPGGEEKSREEQSRAEQRRAEGEGVGEGGVRVPPARPPSAHAEEGPRMRQLNPILARADTVPWSDAELAALRASGLLGVHELDFIDQVSRLAAFYRAKIPREMAERFRKRTSMLTLLRNWPGELDKANTWAREQPAAPAIV